MRWSRALLALLVVVPALGGCVTDEREWMKLNERYTVDEFRRDREACSKTGKLDDACMRSRGWVAVNPGGKPEGSSGIEWLGIQYQDLTNSLRGSFGVPDDVEGGIVVTNVAPTSPLYEQLRPGTIISEINGQSVKSAADFERIVKSAKPGSYLRFYTLLLDPRGGSRSPQSNFAVVQVPSGR